MKNIYLIISAFLVSGVSVGANNVDSLAVFPQASEFQIELFKDAKGVCASDFTKSPEIDVAKALYGKIPGLRVIQGIGASADNFSSLNFHGHVPLVLVDGIERSISDLVALEIESCTVLKDAAAAALYGVKGANGVVLITTKRGSSGKLKVNVGYQFGVGAQFRAPSFVEAYDYAAYYNNACLLDGVEQRYSEKELAAFKSGEYPYYYPNVNWWNETHNRNSFNHRLNVSLSGGNEKIRYYTVVDYMYDKGMLKENTGDDRYSSKPTDTRLNVRTNLDVKLSETTSIIAGLAAKLKEKNMANSGNIYNVLYNTPSAAFPLYLEDGTYGGSVLYGTGNPVALLNSTGNTRSLTTSLLSDVQLRQRMDFITKGLSASLSVSFDYTGSMNDVSSKEYKYVDNNPSIASDGTLILNPVVYGKDSETLSHTHAFSNLYMRSNLEGNIDYSRSFGLSDINAEMKYYQNSYIAKGRNLSNKRQGALFSINYGFDNRYSISGVINYSGSSYLPKGDRFNLFYGANFSWNAKEESFLKEVDEITRLKLSASYGLSGWDGNMTHELYLQSYGDTGAGSYVFTDNVTSFGGQAEGTLPVENLKVEKSRKSTLGLEIGFLDDRLRLYGEGFYDYRYDILVSNTTMVSNVIGINVSQVNAGEEKYFGADFGILWDDKVGDLNYGMYFNGTYMNSELVNCNQAFQEYDYLYKAGNPVGQMYGLEVMGFFNSQQDINNSPIHTFTTVKPGDIKYKDQNGDNKIDDKDIVRMFGSSLPKMYFGFGLNLSYKGFSMMADFQGATGVTVNLLNSPLYKPLVNNGNLSCDFLKNEIPWTPANADVATMPRMTTVDNTNNYRANSLWYRDGSFLKLRNLRLAYKFSKEFTNVSDIELYVQGTNLFSLDNLKILDPENMGATYPTTRNFWVGMNFNF